LLGKRKEEEKEGRRDSENGEGIIVVGGEG
jgi:hypothetical protein